VACLHRYPNWPDRFPRVTEEQYDSYIYLYECRMSRLLEAMMEKRLGSINYWRRRNFLQKFDEWEDDGGDYPWYWGFEEIKEKRHGKIKTPMQAIKTLRALLEFVMGEIRKDPSYEPPDEFIKLLIRVEPWISDLRAIAEAQLKVIGEEARVN
jgi:hypothetical protein